MTIPILEPAIKKFELRDYQIAGVEFLQQNKRAMLLDAPGLGKTAQATFAAKTPTLIVCPAYLVPQWEHWLKEELGYNAVGTIGNRFERAKILESFPDWLVVNYEMLDNFDHFKDAKWVRHWTTIIYDESHHLKGHAGKRAKIAVKLSAYAEYVFELTGTPIKREIDDLFMQFRILQPGIFTSYWRFVKQFCITEDSYFGVQIKGAKKSMLPELKKLMDILSLGRTYEDAGRQLPPIIEKYILIKLHPELQKIYDESISYFRALHEAGELRFENYMSAIHTLRQHLTGGVKLEALKPLIDDETHKTVIWTWYKSTADYVSKTVPDCIKIDGSIPAKDRKALALSSKHIAATIASIPEGIDLSASRNVIFLEEDWTPGTNHQALSRIARERQEGEDNSEPVIVYYVHCQNTIDEVVHRTSKSRGATAKEVVESALYL